MTPDQKLTFLALSAWQYWWDAYHAPPKHRARADLLQVWESQLFPMTHGNTQISNEPLQLLLTAERREVSVAATVDRILNLMPDTHRTALMDRHNNVSQTKTAEKCGISQQRVSQLVAAATRTFAMDLRAFIHGAKERRSIGMQAA